MIVIFDIPLMEVAYHVVLLVCATSKVCGKCASIVLQPPKTKAFFYIVSFRTFLSFKCPVRHYIAKIKQNSHQLIVHAVVVASAAPNLSMYYSMSIGHFCHFQDINVLFGIVFQLKFASGQRYLYYQITPNIHPPRKMTSISVIYSHKSAISCF